MREQIEAYVQSLFSDAALTIRNAEIQQEILQHTLDCYDDLLAAGKSEQEAYDAAIGGIGDVSALYAHKNAAETPKRTFPDPGTETLVGYKLSPFHVAKSFRYAIQGIENYMQKYTILDIIQNKKPLFSLKSSIFALKIPYCGQKALFLHSKNDKKMKVQIINKGRQPLPAYATPQSAGMDLRANIDEPIVLHPMERRLVPTGLYMALPVGYEAQIRPRSGLALKHGITVLNTPGTIDADYRGELMVLLINFSQEDFVIQEGERIAQMVIAKHEQAEFVEVETLDETERGAGGYGHTGVK